MNVLYQIRNAAWTGPAAFEIVVRVDTFDGNNEATYRFTYASPTAANLALVSDIAAQATISFGSPVTVAEVRPLEWLGVATPPVSVAFSGSGPLGVATNVGMWWWNRTGGVLTITDVTMWREIAGISGSTIGDIEVDPGGTGGAFATIYAPANRPAILFSAGAQAFTQANVFATTSVPNGAIVRFKLATVESGSPQNVLAQITMQ